MNRRQFTVSLKVFFSFLVLTWLLNNIDFQALVKAFSRASVTMLTVVLLINLAGVALSVYKWQKLLMHDGLPCGYFYLLNLYFFGIFFNNYLPTSVGGDAVRGLMLARKYNQPSVAITSIFAERFSGLLAMFPLIACGYLFAGGSLGVSFHIGVEVVVVILSLATIGWIGTTLLRRFGQGRVHPGGNLQSVVAGLRRYLVCRRIVWTLTWSSLVFQLLAVGVYWAAGIAFNLHVEFAVFLLVVPLVTLLTLLPISLNGLGLREGGMVYLLSRAGVEDHDALALSLAVYGVSLVLAFIGGLSWAWGRSADGFPESN